MGKLIVIEGLDGCGKSTQLSLLPAALQSNGVSCRSVSFPNYESDSSALVRMYLSGAFGARPGDVNAYAASVFYAADRYASYKTDWGDFYRQGGTVVAGRYTTANAVHQCSKLPQTQWKDFLGWLYDFEYEKIGIPRPDLVLFLDMPVAVSQKLLSHRYEGDSTKKDIHEQDTAYLARCREAALFTADYSGWQVISCAAGDEPRAVGEIADDITRAALAAVTEGTK